MIGPSGEDAILHADVPAPPALPFDRSESSLLATYDIVSTVTWLKEHAFTIVGLQFPDVLLPISVPVFRALRARLPASVELYVMADTTYGSCCVDEIAAQHVNAQAIVHYGSACLSTTARLPVFYVLPRLALSDETTEHVCKQLADYLVSGSPLGTKDDQQSEEIMLMYDLGYHWKIAHIAERLEQEHHLPIVMHQLSTKHDCATPEVSGTDVPASATRSGHGCCQSAQQSRSDVPETCSSQTADSTPQTGCCRTLPQPAQLGKTEADRSSWDLDFANFRAVFYVGGESRRLTHLLVTNPSVPILAIDPAGCGDGPGVCELQNGRTNKLLMRRYATIQRARDADVFGILVGTLGVRHYLGLIQETKRLVESTFKKKAYVVSVGKLKPEKLINFAEVECWVLVDCPENSLLMLDSPLVNKQYPVPIISPWELEIALNSCLEDDGPGKTGRRVWDGKLVLDFERLLQTWQSDCPSRSQASESQLDAVDRNAPVFSLVTGGYKYRRNWNSTESNSSTPATSDLLNPDTKRELIETINGAASEFAIKYRTFNGLEPRIGLDQPGMVQRGRFGIAQGYENGDGEWSGEVK